MIACALIGNSTIRHAVFQGDEVVDRGVFTLPAEGFPLPAEWIPREIPVEAIVLGSVNPARLAEVFVGLEGGGPRVFVAGRDLAIPIPNRYADPSEVGADRLLNALAVSKRWPGRGAVVLDFGTAFSVSVVSPEGEFLGGPIAAGIATAAAGLASRTARLPRVRPEGPPARLTARSTREALEAGIYDQILGGAARILEGLRAELTFPSIAVATGGDAPLFAPYLPAIEAVDPDLALRGLAICYSLKSNSPRRHGDTER